jgi:hypothetical protein
VDIARWDRRWISVPEHLKTQYCYEDSPICVADGSPALPDTPQFTPSTRPGSRAPHAWLPDGRSTLDLFGNGFALLRLGADLPDTSRLREAAGAHRVPLAEVAIADPSIAALYQKRLVLVRPDGHVAWGGDDLPPDSGAVIDCVHGAQPVLC